MTKQITTAWQHSKLNGHGVLKLITEQRWIFVSHLINLSVAVAWLVVPDLRPGFDSWPGQKFLFLFWDWVCVLCVRSCVVSGSDTNIVLSTHSGKSAFVYLSSVWTIVCCSPYRNTGIWVVSPTLGRINNRKKKFINLISYLHSSMPIIYWTVKIRLYVYNITKVTQKVFRPDCTVYDRKITEPSACWGVLG